MPTYNSYRADFRRPLIKGKPAAFSDPNTYTVEVRHNGRASWEAAHVKLTTHTGKTHQTNTSLGLKLSNNPLAARQLVEGAFQEQVSDWAIVGVPNGSDWQIKYEITHAPAVPVPEGSVKAAPIRAICNRQTVVGRLDAHYPTCERCKERLAKNA